MNHIQMVSERPDVRRIIAPHSTSGSRRIGSAYLNKNNVWIMQFDCGDIVDQKFRTLKELSKFLRKWWDEQEAA